MDIWPFLEEELIRYRDITSLIRQYLINYEQKCVKLISNMKGKSFEEVQDTFDCLYDIQQKLSIVSYKYEFNLSDNLKDFVYYFDRDDIYSRQYWYQKFNDGLTWPRD